MLLNHSEPTLNKELKLIKGEKEMSRIELSQVPIGAVVQVANQENTLRYLTKLIGMESESYVLTKLPKPKDLGLSEDMFKSIFKPSNTLIFRILGSGIVYAFESVLIEVAMNGKLLLSQIPEAIQSRCLRQQVRYPCALSAHLSIDGEVFEGVITNISAGGCQIATNESAVQLPANITMTTEALKNKTVDIQILFPLQEETVPINAQVKSVLSNTKGGYLLGVSFEEDPGGVKAYLDSLHLEMISSFF